MRSPCKGTPLDAPSDIPEAGNSFSGSETSSDSEEGAIPAFLVGDGAGSVELGAGAESAGSASGPLSSSVSATGHTGAGSGSLKSSLVTNTLVCEWA